jgi:hypothetical protein
MQGNQHFEYHLDTQQIYHPTHDRCLDCEAESGKIFMNLCNDSIETQKWKWEYVDEKLIAERNAKQGL